MFQFIKTIIVFSVFALMSWNAYAKKSACELSYLNALQDDMRHMMSESSMLNLWDPKYDAAEVIDQLKKMNDADRVKFVENLQAYVDKTADVELNRTFNIHMTEVINEMMQKGFIKRNKVRSLFNKFETTHSKFSISQNSSTLYYVPKDNPAKDALIDKIIGKANLSKQYSEEYRKILQGTNATTDDIREAIQAGIKLPKNQKDLERFREYMQYLNKAKKLDRKKGFKYVNNIYNYNYKHNLFPSAFLRVDKKFLNEISRATAYENKRVGEILRDLKLQENEKVKRELEEIAIKELKGEKVDDNLRAKLERELEDTKVSPMLKKRAIQQAKEEARIYKNLLGSCYHGKSSKALSSAKKKYSRFKLALSLGTTPYFYLQSNKDRMDDDEYFWERLGYEMAVSVAFTVVGNKIMTNTNSGFWGKYWEGWWKYTAMELPTAMGYQALFEDHAYFKYIKKHYSDSPASSPNERRRDLIANSPKFKQDFHKLVQYVDMKAKEKNLKWFLRKYFNLGKKFSKDDALKLTQEDILSNEGQDFLLQLVSEEMYYKDMGEWAALQSGNKGVDYWLFNRFITAPPNGLKATVLGMATLHILCAQPFGNAGSWAAVLGLTLADRMFLGGWSYVVRNQAINR